MSDSKCSDVSVVIGTEGIGHSWFAFSQVQLPHIVWALIPIEVSTVSAAHMLGN